MDNPFSISTSTGIITLASPSTPSLHGIDHEPCTSYVVNVIANYDTPTKQKACAITVNVRNKNDMPFFNPLPGTNGNPSGFLQPVEVLERSKRNTAVGTMDYALDEDDSVRLRVDVVHSEIVRATRLTTIPPTKTTARPLLHHRRR